MLTQMEKQEEEEEGRGDQPEVGGQLLFQQFSNSTHPVHCGV